LFKKIQIQIFLQKKIETKPRKNCKDGKFLGTTIFIGKTAREKEKILTLKFIIYIVSEIK
jgi:hypothetical protein